MVREADVDYLNPSDVNFNFNSIICVDNNLRFTCHFLIDENVELKREYAMFVSFF